MNIHLLFILLVVPTAFSETNYCEIQSCPHKSHTLCKYAEPGMSSKCGNKLPFELGKEEINTILRLHNDLLKPNLTEHEQRLILERSPQYNRPSLEWDEELALIAQRWADQCKLRLDTCRNVERFNVTQKFGMHSVHENEESPSMLQIVFKWHHDGIFSSLQDLNLEGLSLEEAVSSNSRYLKRMVWGTARKIGCGANQAAKKLQINLMLVCNYGPS